MLQRGRIRECSFQKRQKKEREHRWGRGPRRRGRETWECRARGRLRARTPPGEDAQQQKRQQKRGLEQRRGREEEPVGATCGGSGRRKRQEQARGGHRRAGAGRSRQVEMVRPAAPRPAVDHRPQPVTTPEPQCPQRLQASFMLLGAGGTGHAVSVGLFCQLCACGGYPRML